jgi:hypothetical protein
MFAVWKERNLHCIDLDAKLTKDQSFYIDYVHFTEAGSREAAQLIASELTNQSIITQN